MRPGTRAIAIAIVVSGLGCRGILGIDDPIAIVDAPDGTVDGGGPPHVDAAAPCPLQASYTPSFGSGTSAVDEPTGSGSSATDTILWNGPLDTGLILAIELRAPTEDFPGVPITMTKGVLDLSTASDTQTQTCGACVFVGTLDGSEQNLQELYLATSGSLIVFEVTPELVGELQNAQFSHVVVDQTTGVSTRIDDGCGTDIPSASFDTVVVSSPP